MSGFFHSDFNIYLLKKKIKKNMMQCMEAFHKRLSLKLLSWKLLIKASHGSL